MLWTIWVEPNALITEEYPNSWNSSDVMRAANNRYGGKVSAVHPAATGHSSPSGGGSSNSSSGGSGGSGCLVLLGLVGIVLAGVFGGGEMLEENSTPRERTYEAPVERVEAAPAPQWEYTPAPEPEVSQEPVAEYFDIRDQRRPGRDR